MGGKNSFIVRKVNSIKGGCVSVFNKRRWSCSYYHSNMLTGQRGRLHCYCIFVVHLVVPSTMPRHTSHTYHRNSTPYRVALYNHTKNPTITTNAIHCSVSIIPRPLKVKTITLCGFMTFVALCHCIQTVASYPVSIQGVYIL